MGSDADEEGKPVDDLVDTTEMYLKSVLELEEEGTVPLRARISERLEQAGPTVSQTVARLQRDGLLTVSDERHLVFTPEGRSRAIAVMRKHRLAECFLLDVIGLDWEHVHEEACRWEHVMSDEVEERLAVILGHPRRTPYGNPIPHEDDPERGRADGAMNLVRFAAEADEPRRATIVALGEPLQVDPALLGELRREGIVPDARGTFSLHGPTVHASIEGGDEVELQHETAAHIFVA